MKENETPLPPSTKTTETERSVDEIVASIDYHNKEIAKIMQNIFKILDKK